MSEKNKTFSIWQKTQIYKEWAHLHKSKEILHGKKHHKQNQETWQTRDNIYSSWERADFPANQWGKEHKVEKWTKDMNIL